MFCPARINIILGVLLFFVCFCVSLITRHEQPEMIPATMTCLDRNFQFPQQRHLTVECDSLIRWNCHRSSRCFTAVGPWNLELPARPEDDEPGQGGVGRDPEGGGAVSLTKLSRRLRLSGKRWEDVKSTPLRQLNTSTERLISDPRGLWGFQYATQWMKTLWSSLLWKENVLVLCYKNTGK